MLLVKQHPWSLVCEATERAVQHRTFHEQAVRLELQQIVNGPLPCAVCQLVDTSAYPALLFHDATGVRDLSIYDAVLIEAAAESQSCLAP